MNNDFTMGDTTNKKPGRMNRIVSFFNYLRQKRTEILPNTILATPGKYS